MDNDFVQIITDQREDKSLFRSMGWVYRDEELSVSKEGSLMQIITGVRRSGKSTLAHRSLENREYAYINFDDERLGNLSSNQLNTVFESLYQVYRNFEFLFLDEIQNVENWHLFVNRLHRTGIKLIITGSNSKLLSSELASHLTGRYNIVELFPFSFAEFLRFKKYETGPMTTTEIGKLKSFFDEYINMGGFPDILKGADPVKYALNLFNAIVSRDILFRFNIKHKQTFRDIATFLVSNFSREISYNRLKKLFELGSEHTAKNYVSYLEEAYLIITLPKFSFKKQESIRNRKSYIIDASFARAMSDNFTQNKGFLYENIVLLELLRRRKVNHFDLYYYKKNVEVDFLIYKNLQVTELIQVCYDLENERTFKRETRSLLQAATEMNVEKLTIISGSGKQTLQMNEKTIQVVPIYEWLLNQ
jgi:predicted AAA+ superfamily ATPase